MFIEQPLLWLGSADNILSPCEVYYAGPKVLKKDSKEGSKGKLLKKKSKKEKKYSKKENITQKSAKKRKFTKKKLKKSGFTQKSTKNK